MRKLFFIITFSAFISYSCSKYQVRHTVQYFISSEGNMNVGFNDANGQMIYLDNVSSTWKYAFNAPQDGRFLTLVVSSVDGNIVSGAILVDGEEAAISNSSEVSVTITTRLP